MDILEPLLHLIDSNREWLFSGAGLALLLALFKLLFPKKASAKKPAGEGAIIEIRGTNLTADDVKSIANSVYENNFPRLQSIAEREANLRMADFSNKLANEISGKVSQDRLGIFTDPDLQYTLTKAVTAAVRKPALQPHLSSLICSRVNSQGAPLREIVYSKAVDVLPDLVDEQLDILTFMVLGRTIKLHNFSSVGEIAAWIQNRFVQFSLDEVRNALINHMNAVGCSASTMGSALLYRIKWDYSELFKAASPVWVSNEQPSSHRLDQSLISDFFLESEACPGKFEYRDSSFSELEERIKRKEVEDWPAKELRKIFEGNYLSGEEVETILLSVCPEFRSVSKAWSFVQHIYPTSVGYVIGASNYFVRTGEVLDVDYLIQ